MLKKELILRDPLSFLGYETDETEKKGNFGAVTSRAGVGKTAFLVQIAISGMLKDNNVLHISIQDPVDKVNLWYKELYLNLTQSHDSKESAHLWESLLTKRFIMTFETESFDFTKLISRIDELRTQNIFTPQLIILDGLSLDISMPTELNQLKTYAMENNFTVWFSVRTHRHQSDDPVTMLKQAAGDADNLFNMIIQLLPHKDKIQVKRLPLTDEIKDRPTLLIDPSTMMIKESSKE
jgi:hypothetical protein